MRIRDYCIFYNRIISNWRYAMIAEARTKSQLIIGVQVTFNKTFCIKLLLMRISLRNEFSYGYDYIKKCN